MLLNSFFTGLNAILPIFILIGLGYLARRTVLNTSMLPALNSFVYYFAVPALLFNASRGQALDLLFQGSSLGAFAVAALLTALITALVCRYGFNSIDFRGLVLRSLSATFANFAYMGIPLILAVLGTAAQGAMIAIILAGNLLLIVGAQLLIEATAQGGLNRAKLGGILERALLRSPIFIATVLGLLCSAATLQLPQALDTALNLLAPAAVPVALFCLGAGLQFTRTHTHWGELGWLIAVKLLLHPALTYLTLGLFAVTDPIVLTTTVLLTALPTGALAHVIALKYQHFAAETAQIVVLSTLLSLLSVAAWSAFLL